METRLSPTPHFDLVPFGHDRWDPAGSGFPRWLGAKISFVRQCLGAFKVSTPGSLGPPNFPKHNEKRKSAWPFEEDSLFFV